MIKKIYIVATKVRVNDYFVIYKKPFEQLYYIAQSVKKKNIKNQSCESKKEAVKNSVKEIISVMKKEAIYIAFTHTYAIRSFERNKNVSIEKKEKCKNNLVLEQNQIYGCIRCKKEQCKIREIGRMVRTFSLIKITKINEMR